MQGSEALGNPQETRERANQIEGRMTLELPEISDVSYDELAAQEAQYEMFRDGKKVIESADVDSIFNKVMEKWLTRGDGPGADGNCPMQRYL